MDRDTCNFDAVTVQDANTGPVNDGWNKGVDQPIKLPPNINYPITVRVPLWSSREVSLWFETITIPEAIRSLREWVMPVNFQLLSTGGPGQARFGAMTADDDRHNEQVVLFV
jgi:hypothetical protein